MNLKGSRTRYSSNGITKRRPQSRKTHVKFYSEKEPLYYIETDISGVGLGARLLKVRDRMNCAKHTAPDKIKYWEP